MHVYACVIGGTAAGLVAKFLGKCPMGVALLLESYLHTPFFLLASVHGSTFQKAPWDLNLFAEQQVHA